MPVFKYPEAQEYKGGCKVGWRYYVSLDDAQAASEVAVREGMYKADLGFDYGYCSPGSIEKVECLGQTLYKVCVP